MIKPDTIITVVHDRTYLVMEKEDGISYVECEYEYRTDTATYDPNLVILIQTNQCFIPFKYNEPAIQKLLSICLQLTVQNSPAHQCNYQPN